MSKPRRWWPKLGGKQDSSRSETTSVQRSYSTQHVELTDFLNKSGAANAVPPEMAVEALVWKALQGKFGGREICTMSYLARDVPVEDKIPKIQLDVLKNFVSVGSIHLAIVPEQGALLANMAAVHDVAEAAGGPAFLHAAYQSFHTRWSHLVITMVEAGLTVAKIHLHGEFVEIEVVGR